MSDQTVNRSLTGEVAAGGPFKGWRYTIRKRFFSIFGGVFEVFNEDGNVVLFSKQKSFRLREDIRVFTDSSQSTEVLRIKARGIIDFGTTYDVFDPVAKVSVGALRRRGIKSMLKDEWILLDTRDQEIGRIREDNMLLAIVRRLLMNLIPQRFDGTVGDRPVCIFRQNFNPFVIKVTLDYSMDIQGLLDRRMGLAAGILLCAIEKKQD